MKRAIILVLDSLGLGSSEDAHLYGDSGSDTFILLKNVILVMQIIANEVVLF